MYRVEIDGLRALSVALVILFHLQIQRFSGGFIGVDVFFVISGYLITSIIVENIAQETFSFRDFYLRRIARIIPPLLATLALGLIASFFLLSPSDLVYTAKQGLAALFSVSNIFFWSVADYWAPDSRYSVFLHTWSLGVEEQFYLVYPFLLWLAHRIAARKGVLGMLLFLLVGGALANGFWLESSDPAAAFYLTPLRFHEFALGGLGSFFARGYNPPGYRSKLNEVGTLLGLGMIVGSAMLLSDKTSFPGVAVLPAIAGALLVILAGSSRTATKLLSNKPMIWLGKTSYSTYLVHWPIIVLYRYYSGPDFTIVEMLGLVIATLLASIPLHYLIERPMRLSRNKSATSGNMQSTLRWTGMIAAALLISGSALIILSKQGWPSRLPENIQYLAGRNINSPWAEKLKVWKDNCKPNEGVLCGKRLKHQTNIILLADSHGPDIYVALRVAYPQANIQASYKMGCPPVFDINVATNPRFPGCVDLNTKRLGVAMSAPTEDIIFLAMDFNWLRAKAIVETTKRLAATGRQVMVLGETRIFKEKNLLALVIKHRGLAGMDQVIEENLVDRPFGLDQDFAARITAAGGTFISNKDFFYNGEYRLFTQDKTDLLMYDHAHLTLPGAREYGWYLAARYPIPRPE